MACKTGAVPRKQVYHVEEGLQWRWGCLLVNLKRCRRGALEAPRL